jgi:hypothetical protein
MTKPASVAGRVIPNPRPTAWCVLCVLLYVGAPLVGLLLALDVALYLVFTRVLGRCYGVFCLFG